MKIPVWILSTLLSAALAGEAWTVKSIVDLKVSVASIQATLESKNNSQSAPVSSQSAKVAVNNP